ncbi:MAG TPA: tail fiber protein [Pyrinomonadaceae bacterium]|jgi:microcystin-dependent protein|nr:tail fiber protein [Pyrinomonadaceae bacterium]
MSEPFLSEIKIVSFNFAPKGWALCNGQSLPINQNQALFSLLGTTYGGNGQTTFNLPNLRGQVPIHMGNGHTLGEKAGTTSVTINIQQLPTHLHFLQGTTATANTNAPDNTTLLAGSAPNDLYTGPTTLSPLIASTVTSIGGSQPHNNMMPYLVLNFIIALQGIFPSQN